MCGIILSPMRRKACVSYQGEVTTLLDEFLSVFKTFGATKMTQWQKR